MKDVWVIVPAYNEEKNIGQVILDIKKFCDNIIVVDDGSDDKTAEIAEKNCAIVLQHIVNMGKGAALKTGCDYAYKKGAKQIVLMDSDGQHQASEIPNFLRELVKNDVVFGYRSFNKKMPFIFKLGNYVITLITKLFYQVNIHDTQSGYRAFRSEIYKKIRWKASDYSVESEMITYVGKNKLKYHQIPIQTIYADNYKGTTILDGMKIVWNMCFWRIR